MRIFCGRLSSLGATRTRPSVVRPYQLGRLTNEFLCQSSLGKLVGDIVGAVVVLGLLQILARRLPPRHQ